MSEKLRRAQYLLSEIDPRNLLASRAEVAVVGRSNVGKSSFLNAIFQSKLVKVSNTPGRTRAINVFSIDHLCWLVDLPGYGYAVGPIESREGWSAMIEGYLTSRPSLRCIFVLIDAKVGPTKLDIQMLHWLKGQKLPYRILANKIDQVKPSKRLVQQNQIARGLGMAVSDIAWISATEGIGIPRLRQEIGELLTP